VGTQDVTMEVCKGLNTESSIEGDEEPVEGIIERSSEGLLEGSFLSIIIDAVMDGSDGLTIDGWVSDDLPAGTIVNDDSRDNIDVSSYGKNNDVVNTAEDNNDDELSSAVCFKCSSIYALE